MLPTRRHADAACACNDSDKLVSLHQHAQSAAQCGAQPCSLTVNFICSVYYVAGTCTCSRSAARAAGGAQCTQSSPRHTCQADLGPLPLQFEVHFDNVATDLIDTSQISCLHKLKAATAASVVYTLPPGGQRFFPDLQQYAEAAVTSSGLRVFGLVALLNTSAEVESFAAYAREHADSTDPETWARLTPDVQAEVNVRSPPTYNPSSVRACFFFTLSQILDV